MDRESGYGKHQVSIKVSKMEILSFSTHEKHYSWSKLQSDILKKSLPLDSIIVKADFIKNIVHQRGAEVSNAYYNKRQSQLLTFVVWHHEPGSSMVNKLISKKNYDFLSSYLTHSSLFFQKCFDSLISLLINDLPVKFKKVYINTDGARSHLSREQIKEEMRGLV